MASDAPGAVALIAAVARNGVIGAGNALPWKLPEDMARFRALTTGHTVVMGRKTWQSLGRPLKDRENIVVTRDAALRAEGARTASSLPEAIALATLPLPVFCIGGGDLYAQALPLASVMHITEIDRDFAGDVRFPRLDAHEWRVEAREERVAADGMRYAFVTYRRNREP